MGEVSLNNTSDLQALQHASCLSPVSLRVARLCLFDVPGLSLFWWPTLSCMWVAENLRFVAGWLEAQVTPWVHVGIRSGGRSCGAEPFTSGIWSLSG